MARRPRTSAALVAGILTIFILGIIWTVVLHNLQTQKGIPVAPSFSAADPPLPPSSESPSSARGTLPHESSPSPTVSLSPPTPPDPRVRREPERNCLAVLEKLCQDVPPGSGRRRQCFQDNVGNLSPACQVKLQAKAFRVRESTQQIKAACRSDAKRLCPKVPLAGGRILQCLEDHAKELSDGCDAALE